MSYTSPFLNPQPYVSGVNNLSTEGITIDEGVARALRQAADFSNNYSGNWSLVSSLKDTTAQFNEAGFLLQSERNLEMPRRPSRPGTKVFLSMINDVESQQDAKDLATELNALLREEYPSKKYQLDSTPGPKKAFEEIEGLVTKESEHIVQVLHDGKDWQKSTAELKKDLPSIQGGVGKIRGALNNYATKLA
ncbi:hypothetical protein H1R20_g10100, partial [Candolleomyces eurysporus]